ncbi:membrane protein insertase YidC [Janthinobacterium agaricidamnosum]|uniref:Membrane protein insertase YidC n=1 Tax=Janthinobacterium agaricidamnosum NBRC 102515 = DSM 9628 TaxID=1349767 RepID=W0UWS0_9BURK|nr:membrane protein insertase YidC [Janthinobacterium agaricidamnosum]CDG80889.1 60Kd inner membrane family protein [Janthinobacterium agaricidamnosum NBRC 102515 = DSM 9628]
MDINKRTILWIVFSVSLVVLWNDWMVSNGKQSMFSATPEQAVKAPAAPGANGALPAASGASALPGAAVADAAFKSERITITTDVIKADIDTLGGQVKRLELLKYKSSGHPGWFGGCFGLFKWCQPDADVAKNEVLFDEGIGHTYLAQTGLIGGSAGAVFPNHTSGFVAQPGVRTLTNGDTVQLVLDSVQGGIKLTKTFTFKRGDYVIDVKHTVTNVGDVPVKPELYMQLVHDGNKPAGDSYFNSSYTGPTMYTDADKYKKLTFDKIEKETAESIKTGRPMAQDHAVKADNGWFAISQHFFVSAFVPQDKLSRDIFTKKVDTNVYAIGNVLPIATLAPGASATVDAKLYSGPQISHLLETVSPGLELVKDYGWLTIIAKPIFWVMEHIHGILGNWGFTIIAFTILIKLLFFPLSAAGYRSMAKMKLVTPKMQALRERYKGDPQKMNQATMELYKTEKINPLGGCLPILVQMPVFIALYWVLNASVEIRGAPWIGWITDLAQHDPWCILPVLYAISMFITTKLNPAPADPMQAKMMLFMPLAFSVMFFFFPSGLVLYWVVNNVLSIGQQWVITKKYAPAAAK